MTEPIDLMQPWTVKSVPVRTRDAIKQAAMQEGITVGQWLERRVGEWLNAGSPVQVQAPITPLSSDRVSDVAKLADATAKLASLPGDQPMVKTARILVRQTMLAMRHTEPQTGSALVPTSRSSAVAHANGN